MSWESDKRIKAFQQVLKQVLDTHFTGWDSKTNYQQMLNQHGIKQFPSFDSLKRWTSRDNGLTVPQVGSWNDFMQAARDPIAPNVYSYFQREFEYIKSLDENPIYQRAIWVHGEWFFGINDTIANLLDRNNRWQKLIFTGMGGIGKTTHKRALIQELIAENLYHHNQIVSITADQITDSKNRSKSRIHLQQILRDLISCTLHDTSIKHLSPAHQITAISEALQDKPYLITFDNLHTLEDYELLKSILSKLPSNVRTIVGTRAVPNDTNLNIPKIHELGLHDSMCLMLHQGYYKDKNAQNCRWIANINVDELLSKLPIDAVFGNSDTLAKLLVHPQQEVQYLASIYKLVGGNPLGINLLIGQFKKTPPGRVLDDFESTTVATDDEYEMYEGIYEKVLRQLDEPEQVVLKMMAELPAIGATEEDIDEEIEIFGHDRIHIQKAISTLSQQNLLNIDTTDFSEYRYSIHQLTRTFVRTNILGFF